MQLLPLEHDVGDDGKDEERDTLLHHFQLNQREGAAIAYEAHAVGRHLTAVLEEGNAPRENDDAYEWPRLADACLAEFQMPIPSKRHEDVA